MADQPAEPGTLFLGTRYHICPALPPSIQEGLESILSTNGGVRASGVEDPKLNVVITRSEKFEGWEVVAERNRKRKRGVGGGEEREEEEEEEIHVVTPIWADRSVMLGKRQFPHHFSVLPSMIFSGVAACACSATIPAQDLETLSAGITALGGQWRAHLTSEVTHLFVLNPSLNLDPRTGMLPEQKDEENGNELGAAAGGNALATRNDEKEKEIEKEKEKERQLAILLDISPKYSTAMHYQAQTGIKVVLPHWFDDCVKMGKRVDERPYEWPEVRVLKGVDGVDSITGDAIPDANGNVGTKEKERKEREAKEREREKERAEMGEEEKEREAIKKNVYATAALFTPALDDVGIPSEADLMLVNETVFLNGAPTTTAGAAGKKEKENQSMLAALAPIVTGDGETRHQVWAGRRILLSRTLKLYGSRRDAVQAQIERAGGVVVRYEGDVYDPGTPPTMEGVGGAQGKWKANEDGIYEVLSKDEKARRRKEAEMVKECDVLVTRWRDGRAYIEAIQTNKTIGTLAWFFHVQSTGLFARPLDQLLHYPTPKRPIDGFDSHVVTVTNYTGEAREYIKKLINAMGGRFTPSMSSENTALVAAYISGTKANKALSWQIPVVNHIWLEDCFAQWRNLTPARPKYITFPPGVDFSKMLGERGVPTGLVGVPNTMTATRGGVGLVGNTRFVNGVEVEGQVESEEEVLGRIEREAEELAELLDMEEEEEAEMEAQAEAEARARERDGDGHGHVEKPPNGTEESMRRVSEELVGGQGEEFDFEPSGAGAGGMGEVDWTMGGMDDEEEEDGVMRRTSTPKKGKGGGNAKGDEKTKTTKATPTKSSSVVPGTSSPVKLSTKKMKVDRGVIELEDSSNDDDEEQRVQEAKAKAKSKAKAKEQANTKEVISQTTPTATPQKKKKNLAEVVLTTSSKKSVNANANSNSKAKVKAKAKTEESDEDDDEPDEEVSAPRPSQKKTDNIPPSSPLSEINSPSPSPSPSPSQPKKGRRKLVRRLVGSSSVSVVGGGEEHTETNGKEAKGGEQKTTTTTTRRVLTKRVTGSALVIGGQKGEEENKDEDVEAEEEEEKRDERPRKKAKTTDAPAPNPKSTTALLNKIVMTKGDARTRVKKRNPNAPPKRKHVEESEDEDEDEKEEMSEDEVVVVSRGKGKKADEKKVKEKTKTGGKKKAETSDEEKVEEVEDAVSDEEEPTKSSKSKSKPKTSGKNKSDPKSTANAKSDLKTTKTTKTTKSKSGKPLRVYSPMLLDNSDSDSSDANANANKSNSDDDDDDDFDELPSDPLMPTKSELRAIEREKAKKAEEEKAKGRKGKGKTKVVQQEAEEEEEDAPKTKKKNNVQAKSTSASKAKIKANAASSTSAVPKTKKRARTPTPSPSPFGPESESDSGPPPPPTKKTTTTKKGTTTAAVSSSSKTKTKNADADTGAEGTKTKMPVKRVLSVLMPSLSLSPKKTGMKGKSVKEKEKEKVVTSMDTDEDGEEEATEVEEAVKSKPKSTNAKGKSAPAVTSKSKSTKATRNKQPTPATDDEGDENENEEEEEEEVSAIISTTTSPRAKRALAREESIRTVSGHVQGISAAAASTTMRKTTTTTGTKNTTSVSAKVGSGSRTKTLMAPPAVPVTAPPHSQSQSQSQSQRPNTTRTAAANATRKLHESIMPDVLQYEAQVAKARYKSKSKGGRSGSSAAFVVEGDSVYGDEDRSVSVSVNGRGKMKRKDDEEDVGGREAKKRKVSREEEEDGEEADEEHRTKAQTKAKAVKGKGKAKQKEDDEDMDVDENDEEGGGAAKSKSRSVLPGDGIMIMTTQVTLGDDIIKALTTKLGMKFTTRPYECTHLLAPHVVRTEKFLCALALRGPYVVTKDWAVECVKQGKVLPEEDYPLPDAHPEDNKYQVDLARSIKRAREVVEAGKSGNKNKEKTRKLLEGHTFYVTPRVPVDTKLLKNVVVACGGQVSSQTPTLRIISAAPDTRHVISSPEDISIWRPIRASGVKIYTQELVLTGVLRMEVGWDDEGFMVKG